MEKKMEMTTLVIGYSGGTTVGLHTSIPDSQPVSCRFWGFGCRPSLRGMMASWFLRTPGALYAEP